MLKSISGFYFNGIGFNCHKRNKAVNHFTIKWTLKQKQSNYERAHIAMQNIRFYFAICALLLPNMPYFATAVTTLHGASV